MLGKRRDAMESLPQSWQYEKSDPQGEVDGTSCPSAQGSSRDD